MTKEQRKAAADKAERAVLANSLIEQLEEALEKLPETHVSLTEKGTGKPLLSSTLLREMLKLGIDAKIARLEQELADKPAPIPFTPPLVSRVTWPGIQHDGVIHTGSQAPNPPVDIWCGPKNEVLGGVHP
jgi:hypothetical protein